MGTPRFTPEFKEEAVRQITERGYSVAEFSDRRGLRTASTSVYGLSSLIIPNSMPGIYWKPKARS
ncbi:hypothetical protein SPARK1531C2_05455 [Klebsiella grimontii]|nr:hypothetical protein SPARK1531C2_05455 [Klebsiella grimontii]